MGDIESHAKMTAHVAGGLLLTPQAQFLANYLFFIELGNYLTDVSQFRDPTAHYHGKLSVLRDTLASGTGPFSLRRVDFRQWADDVFGTPTQRHGSLAQYLEHICRASAYEIAARFPDELRRSLEAHGQQEAANAAVLITPPAAAEVRAVLDARFTQYYPHEHLDFPPLHDPDQWNNGRAVHPRESGRLLPYLREQLRYVAEELANVEWTWKQANRMTPSPARGTATRDFMAWLGHALHTVEDYFFHSNFAEVYWMRRERQRHRASGESPRFSGWFAANALEGRREGGWVRLKRMFYRRVRFPIYRPGPHGEPAPDTSVSRAADQFIYTGGFGERDIYKTVVGGLEGIEARYGSGVQAPWAGMDLVLFDEMFDGGRRAALANPATLESAQDRHFRQTQSIDDVEQRINERVPHGLTREAADELIRAYRLDLRVINDYVADDIGPAKMSLGGVLLGLVAKAQEAVDQSLARSRRIDARNGVWDRRTDNLAFAELIGSHSLMAKDTHSSMPFRGEAMVLARHASVHVARTMALEVSMFLHDDGGTDWDRVLGHYLRFPRSTPGAWEHETIARQVPLGRSELFRFDPFLGDAAPSARLAAGNALLQRRRTREIHDRLENRYRDREAYWDARWLAQVRSLDL